MSEENSFLGVYIGNMVSKNLTRLLNVNFIIFKKNHNKFQQYFLPRIFDYSQGNLKILFQRLKNYESVQEWKQSLFRIQYDPNDIDDSEIELNENDLENYIHLKATLNNSFNVLTNTNFYAHINSSPFTIVFFYLPCKFFLDFIKKIVMS